MARATALLIVPVRNQPLGRTVGFWPAAEPCLGVELVVPGQQFDLTSQDTSGSVDLFYSDFGSGLRAYAVIDMAPPCVNEPYLDWFLVSHG